jgi:hypothetical protein
MRFALLLLLPVTSFAQPLMIDGALDAGTTYVAVPFTVPAGTVELEIAHTTLDTGNILDWGVTAPEGFRGYGGGNTENAVIGVDASSRSYLTGPITAGEWNVYIGAAKVPTTPARYHIEITFRTTATLPAQTQRSPYSPVAALSKTARWYAGDLHCHSKESGDAQPEIEAMITLAKSRGLDFIELSDHNTRSQLDFINSIQAGHSDFLLVPGVEWTTYLGHANGIGVTQWVDHRVGFGGVTADDAASKIAAQGVFSINHPMLDLGDQCIGCKWTHDIPKASLGGIEIGTGGWDKTGTLFSLQSMHMWDGLLNAGLKLAALGGSDDHSAGLNEGQFGSPIGNPTTMVFASELSVSAIVDAIKHGRTVVKLQDATDPMVELDPPIGDATVSPTSPATSISLTATVTKGMGQSVRFVHDGTPLDPVSVTSDPFATKVDATQGRWRAEVMVMNEPRTVTSHVYVGPPVTDVKMGECHCETGSGGAWGLALLLTSLWRGTFGSRRGRALPGGCSGQRPPAL